MESLLPLSVGLTFVSLLIVSVPDTESVALVCGVVAMFPNAMTRSLGVVN